MPEYYAWAIIGLLALIAALLGRLVYDGRQPRQTNRQVAAKITTSIDEATARLGHAVQHYADVSVVAAMVRQLESDPSVIEKLRAYPKQVQAAAWVHYANVLGDALREAQADYAGLLGGYDPDHVMIAHYGARVRAIRAKLGAVIAASRETD